MFKGSYTALITPFQGDAVDDKAFQELVHWQALNGTQGVILGGTTGEAFSLTAPELGSLVQKARDVVPESFEIWAGAGSMSLKESLLRSENAEKNGAHGLLVVTPAYVKPSQQDLVRFYTALHDQTSLKVIIYNNPSRTAVRLEDDTVKILAQLPRIVGLKDSSPDTTRPTALKHHVPKDFAFYAGEDATIASFLAQGGHGWISVTGNLFPKACADLCQAWNVGDLARFIRLRDFLFPLSQVLFKESNPVPVKYALSIMGRCQPDVREPLGPPSERLAQQVESVLHSMLRMDPVSHDHT